MLCGRTITILLAFAACCILLSIALRSATGPCRFASFSRGNTSYDDLLIRKGLPRALMSRLLRKCEDVIGSRQRIHHAISSGRAQRVLSPTILSAWDNAADRRSLIHGHGDIDMFEVSVPADHEALKALVREARMHPQKHLMSLIGVWHVQTAQGVGVSFACGYVMANANLLLAHGVQYLERFSSVHADRGALIPVPFCVVLRRKGNRQHATAVWPRSPGPWQEVILGMQPSTEFFVPLFIEWVAPHVRKCVSGMDSQCDEARRIVRTVQLFREARSDIQQLSG